MKFNDAIVLQEARGAGSFDYKYWFWAKRNSTYGVGYARQDITLEISKKGNEALDALENMKDVLDTLEKGDTEKLEVVEKKLRANTKRITGIVDLFSSPIVINWLTGDKPTIVKVPRSRPQDVTDLDGKTINVVEIFKDQETRDFLTEVMDWEKVIINDKEGDTLNTILAKFISSVFGGGSDKKTVRKVARGSGLEGIMRSLKFEDKGIEVVPFKKSDYNILPQEVVGSKKAPAALQTAIKERFPEILKKARAAF
jgi:hypothetical protein